MRGIHRSPVKFTHKGQGRWALVFSLICAWINGWVNNREPGDLRGHRVHYDVTVMYWKIIVEGLTKEKLFESLTMCEFKVLSCFKDPIWFYKVWYDDQGVVRTRLNHVVICKIYLIFVSYYMTVWWTLMRSDLAKIEIYSITENCNNFGDLPVNDWISTWVFCSLQSCMCLLQNFHNN